MEKIFFAALVAIFAIGPGIAQAQDSAGHSGQASTHSAQSAGHSLAASGKAVSAIGAVPLKVVGGIGKAADAAGDALLNAAGQPLKVDDETVTVGPPPSEALNR